MSFSFWRFWSVFVARNREFYRDVGALGWVFVFPILMVVSFSFVFNLDDRDFFKVAWVGEGHHQQIELLDVIPTSDLEQALEKLRYHKVDLVVKDNAIVWLHSESVKSATASKIFLGSMATVTNSYEFRQVSGKNIPYVHWLFPGILALNMQWMALWGVGWAVVRHRKLGILKRYKASPLTPFEYYWLR